MKITCEGYCDTKAGWEFDAPLLMVKPIMQMHHVGSVHEADRVVDDYIEAISLGEELESDEEISVRVVRKDFKKAKAGSTRFVYWSRDVEIPDDIDWDADDAFERVIYGALQIGVPRPTSEGREDV